MCGTTWSTSRWEGSREETAATRLYDPGRMVPGVVPSLPLESCLYAHLDGAPLGSLGIFMKRQRRHRRHRRRDRLHREHDRKMDNLCFAAMSYFGALLLIDPNGHRFVPFGPMLGIDG
jgi:hypothetical protein